MSFENPNGFVVHEEDETEEVLEVSTKLTFRLKVLLR